MNDSRIVALLKESCMHGFVYQYAHIMLFWASVCYPLICIIAADELQIMN